MNWKKITEVPPPENTIVETTIKDEHGNMRNTNTLIKSKGLWWHTDKSMYVYYTPTHWRSIN